MGIFRNATWLTALAVSPLLGQTHKVAKPETVVRAVGVYEWTGDMAKPAASRFIPITLYIDRHLEDAGVYLARPVPFVLETGNVFELEEAGVAKGSLELSFARHLQAATAAEAYDDGWFGYGSFKALPAPKKTIARKLPPARTSGIVASGDDAAKPHFSNKDAQPTSTTAAAKPDADANAKSEPKAADDPDRPTMKRRAESSSTQTASTTTADDPDRPTMKRRSESTSPDASTPAPASPAPADDPDRPTMKRRSDSGGASTTSSDSPAPVDSASSADDPDRPTLKRRSPEEAKKKAKGDSASVTGTGSLNDDPDRPNLHRGKPASAMSDADLPKLAGLPESLHQIAAVSDAANRPVHDFSRAWEDDAERAAVLAKMQAIATTQLAAYGGPAAPQPLPRRTDSKRRTPATVRIAPVKLLDEQLKGYLLSYGDVPTFVYQAHTEGQGEALRYVTVVAQRDAQGQPATALSVTTDAAHLDRTPRLRLVDAVDVEASNRASLLFEARGQTSRQFTLYRILGQQATQTFTTGTMQ